MPKETKITITADSLQAALEVALASVHPYVTHGGRILPMDTSSMARKMVKFAKNQARVDASGELKGAA